MNKMIIFEPAMCCSTGVCGPSVDKELLRVSTVLSNLKNKGVLIERHNLSSNPQIFVSNEEVHQLLNKEGIEILPITIVDDKVVKTKTYPTDEEFCELLNVPASYLRKPTLKLKSKDCGCSDGCC